MPDDIAADPRQTIADLQREVAQLRGERDEALQQQAATAEVLGIINASPGDLAPVFDAMLDKAMNLCRTSHGEFLTYDGERFHTWSLRGYSAAYADARKKTSASGRPGSISARIIETKRPVHVLDLMADEAYRAGLETRRVAVDIGGVRSVLAVPLLNGDQVLGAIMLSYQEVRQFTDKQIALLENFAAQAVIAMDNARLLGELRERTEALAQRNSEYGERIEQQSATIDVLKVMSASPDDPQPVFDLIAERARAFCDVEFCSVQLLDNDMLRLQAAAGTDDVQMAAFTASFPRPVGRGSTSGRAILTRAAVQVADTRADPEYGPKQLSGWLRSTLSVPMVRAGAAIGAIGVGGSRPGGYSASQVELLETFAEQAVIAIASAETYRALQARTSDLQESLEYQTATSDVLQVISRSAFDLQPVLDTVCETATRLCLADQAVIFRREADGSGVLAANHGFPPEYEAFQRGRGRVPATYVATSPSTAARAARERTVIHYEDVAAVEGYPEALITLGKQRTTLGVPLLREGEPIGVLQLARQRVEPFTERQIDLVRTFADQAVIAIENTRLITETREALERQTATAEVLGVINSSPGDIAPVFDAILEKALRLCEASFGVLITYDGEFFTLATSRGVPPAMAEFARQPFRAERGSASTRLMAGESVFQVPDITQQEPTTGIRALAELGGARTVLWAALRKDDVLLGFLALYRQEVRPFTDKQIALVQGFAAQAVIAMENARLLGELRERTSDLQQSLEYQTATSDVLKVISRSTFDLQPVLNTVVETAARLCAADLAHVVLRDGDLYRSFACFGMSPEFDAFVRNLTFRPGRETTVGRVLLEAGVVQQEDIAADPDYQFREAVASMGSVRSHLGVPMGPVDDPVGVFVLARRRPGRFTDRQVALVKTFADQAVIAIENTRLITETRTARDAAQVALRDLKAAQANLVQAEKMASLGQLTAGIAHEIKNPLNFVNNFAGLSVELLDELKESAAPALGMLDAGQRAELDETFALLTGNLDKIAEHGRRADNIVKSMLEHSRGATSERRKVDLNGLVEEAANLAYHGARAQDANFNITLERDYDRAVAEIELVPQEMNRVLINLIGNGFYAAVQRQRDGADANFRPTLTVATRELGDAVEIRIRDNGTGIAPEIRDKLFQPFFTTKPTGEGTGLGLSISYDIVTQQHAGTIAVDSRVGEFTEFTIRLPRGRQVAETGAAA